MPCSIRDLVLTSVLGLSLAALPAHAVPPQWSTEFASSGIVLDQFLSGPSCLRSFDTPAGPRLFVGGSFNAHRTPGSLATTQSRGLAIWDGRRWSDLPGGGLPSTTGDGQATALVTLSIGDVNRLVVAGFFTAPVTGVGIAWLDDALALHPLPPGTIPSAWIGGACSWTPPSPPPPAQPAAPEIIVTSGIFPQGSDYAYRYTATSFLSLPPGLITVTTAFAEFDDGAGAGRALYIGVPMANAGINQSISRWNGTTLTPVSTGMSWCNALCVHDDGTGPALYAAGQGFRRLRNGVWESVTGPGAPTFNINALASFDDGSGGGSALYVAGQFTTTTPSGSAINVVRLRAGVWEPLGSGLVGGVPKALGVFDEDGPGPRPSGLYVVGKFTTAGGNSSVGIARWGRPICRADWNNSGTLEVQDIFDFLSAWMAQNPAADFNVSGQVTTQDIFDFLAGWFTGC